MPSFKLSGEELDDIASCKVLSDFSKKASGVDGFCKKHQNGVLCLEYPILSNRPFWTLKRGVWTAP